MTRFLKDKILAVLLRLNRWLIYIKPGDVTGFNLPYDLGLVVKSPRAVIFDVGANMGQSIEMFLEACPGCSIYAFEPTPQCAAAIQQNSFGAQVRLFQLALGDVEKTASFHEYEDSVFNSVLPMDKNSENRFSHVEMTRTSTVNVRTVDSMVKELNLSAIDLLKIDTQGFDFHVLQGAVGALKAGIVKAVSVELNFVKMYKEQDSAEAIMAFLHSHGLMLVDLYEKWRHGHTVAWCTAVFMKR